MNDYILLQQNSSYKQFIVLIFDDINLFDYKSHVQIFNDTFLYVRKLKDNIITIENMFCQSYNSNKRNILCYRFSDVMEFEDISSKWFDIQFINCIIV